MHTPVHPEVAKYSPVGLNAMFDAVLSSHGSLATITYFWRIRLVNYREKERDGEMVVKKQKTHF